jgi:hypothetical protein
VSPTPARGFLSRVPLRVESRFLEGVAAGVRTGPESLTAGLVAVACASERVPGNNVIYPCRKGNCINDDHI